MPFINSHLGTQFGFTCQTRLAKELVKDLKLGSYRVWFSTSLNPPRNGSSSNPLIIYQELERILYVNDVNHSRVEQLRRRLTGWIQGTSLPAGTIAAVVHEIA